MDKSAVANAGAEELAELEWTEREKDDTGHKLVNFFNSMAKTRTAERARMEGFLIQAKAGQTMAPILQKTAMQKEAIFGLNKPVAGPATNPGVRAALLNGLPQYQQISAQKQHMAQNPGDVTVDRIKRNMAKVEARGRPLVARAPAPAPVTQVARAPVTQVAKKGLSMSGKIGLGVGAAGLVGAGAYAAHRMMQRKQPVMVQKMASIAPRTEAFFEKRAYLDTAQRLFPELLTAKVAASAGNVAGSAGSIGRPTPSLKPRVASATHGPIATAAPVSVGSA